jgi:parallel beta-helix repeat protein
MPAKLRLHAAPATLVSLAVILAFGAAGLVALSSASTSRSRAAGARRRAPAASPQPKCGGTITADTTLHHDLNNCPNNGILIGADGITLNLNGHTIDGDGTPAAGCDPVKDFCDIGVANDGHDGVTVKHGSMRQMEAGVNLFQAPHNRLLDLSASRNRRVGFSLFESSRSIVKNSSANGLPHEGTGVLLFDSNRVRVLDNSFRDDTLMGISVIGGTGNLVGRNQIRGAGKDGINVDADAKHTLLRGNRATHSLRDDGFDIESGSAKLTGNRANRNSDLGIEAARGVIDGGGNVAHQNGDSRQCTHVVVCN